MLKRFFARINLKFFKKNNRNTCKHFVVFKLCENKYCNGYELYFNDLGNNYEGLNKRERRERSFSLFCSSHSAVKP